MCVCVCVRVLSMAQYVLHEIVWWEITEVLEILKVLNDFSKLFSKI